MATMETFILLVSLSAAAGGSFILLSCLAGRKAELMKAFEMREDMQQRDSQVKNNKGTANDEQFETVGSTL